MRALRENVGGELSCMQVFSMHVLRVLMICWIGFVKFG